MLRVKPIKDFLKQLFPNLIALRNRYYNHFAHRHFKGQSIDKVFEAIYRENHWRDSESKSGTGSNGTNAVHVVQILDQVIRQYGVESILDIPCGDFNWMKNVELENVTYIGADIVADLIEANRMKYSSGKVDFQKIDLVSQTLPRTDLIFCRDCFVHFSYADISRAMQNIKASGARYFMSTTFPEHSNYNIVTGDWRPINLMAAPFHFPDPIRIFDEQCHEDQRYRDKSLALWRVDQLHYLRRL